MKLSIIVPIYNVEEYVARCLDSLLLQDINHKDYEIIVVNDGTKDNSVNIIKEYQQKYSNIILLEKENGGLSSARNLGLLNCKGEYIWMVDSDDSIKSNCLKSLLNYAKKNDVDFLSFPMNDIFSTEKIILSNNHNKPKNIIVSNYEYVEKYKVEYSACCFLIKKEIVFENKIKFIEGILHEDIDFVIRLLEYCHKVSSFQENGGLYNYYVGRPNSITTTKNYDKYIKSLESFYISIDSLNKKYSSDSKYGISAQLLINNMKCYALSYLLYYPLPKSQRDIFFEKYKKINAYEIGATSFLSWKLNLLKKIYNFPYLYKILLNLVSLVRN